MTVFVFDVHATDLTPADIDALVTRLSREHFSEEAAALAVKLGQLKAALEAPIGQDARTKAALYLRRLALSAMHGTRPQDIDEEDVAEILSDAAQLLDGRTLQAAIVEDDALLAPASEVVEPAIDPASIVAPPAEPAETIPAAPVDIDAESAAVRNIAPVGEADE